MVKVLGREKAHFRIQIYDLVRGKSRNISLSNHSGLSADDLKEIIINALEDPEATEKYLKKKKQVK
jgi:hypothetical protein